MKPRNLRASVLPAAILLLSAVVTGTYAIAQGPPHQVGTYGDALHENLSEKQTYIRDCRDVIETVQAPVYTSSDLQNGRQATPIQTLPAGTQVRLTGVLVKVGDNHPVAQIYLNRQSLANGHAVGWVSSNKLTQTNKFCAQ